MNFDARRFAALFVLILLGIPAVSQGISRVVEHSQMCDASAAVAVGSKMFVVANDEDNVLRVYRRDQPGKPLQEFDLNTFLKPDAKNPEADIEGATQVGDRIYWITSHGRNKDDKLRPSRHRFFATTVKVTGETVSLAPVGTAYQELFNDLVRATALEKYQEALKEAATLAPEKPGGLNIEGLTATPQGALLVAFRNPIPGGKALLVPLENPDEVINGKAARLGEPFELPLENRGIRSIEWSPTRQKYLIVAGPPADQGKFALYQWSGKKLSGAATGDNKKELEPLERADFQGFTPEAMVLYPDEKASIQFLSDDGTKQVNGQKCKDAPLEMRSFRSFWVSP